MNAKQVTECLMNDPLICAFLMRGDYFSDRKKTWMEYSKERETEALLSEPEDNLESNDEPKVLLESQMKRDLVQFIIDLIQNFSDDEIIYEFRRIQSRIDDPLRHDFFSSLVKILENDRNDIRHCLKRVVEFRPDPKMAHLFSGDDVKKATDEAVEKYLPTTLARIESLCIRFSDAFLSPNFEFQFKSYDDEKINPPFIWMRGGRALSELLMFLSVGGWLKLNPKVLNNVQAFSILLTKLFCNKESEVRFTKKAFQEYFLNQSVDLINNMRKKDLYELSEKRFKVSELQSNPFDCLIKDVSD